MDKILTPEEVAERLRLSVEQVIQAAEAGDIRGFQVAGQWRFEVDALTTLGAGSRRTPPSDTVVAADLARDLVDLLPEEHIIPELVATSGPGIVYEVAARAYALGLVSSETWFAGALAERESMLSTAVDGGLAFLHARQANCARVERPFVLLGRSTGGVDFGAPDGEPTRLFFVLGLKYDRLHLKWLSRLARMLRSEHVVERLVAAESAHDMHRILLGEDESVPA